MNWWYYRKVEESNLWDYSNIWDVEVMGVGKGGGGGGAGEGHGPPWIFT